MCRHILYLCIAFAAFTALPKDAAGSRQKSLPFKANHIEKLTSAKYVGPGVVKGNDVAHRLSKRSVATVDENQCTQKYGCLNCSWVKVCAPTSDDTFVEISRSACPSDRPFCNPKTGSCGVDTSSQCMKSSNLTCFKKEGYFPHPTDCKKFIYCNNYTSFLFECLGQYYYNPVSQQCNNYGCYTVTCAGNEGRKVQYPSSNVFFAYCSGGTPVGVDRCLGNDILNTTSQLCEPNCSVEGLIRDNLNCTKYYKCSYEWMYNNRYLVKKHYDCEAGESFKPEEFQCVKGVPETGCIQSY